GGRRSGRRGGERVVGGVGAEGRERDPPVEGPVEEESGREQESVLADAVEPQVGEIDNDEEEDERPGVEEHLLPGSRLRRRRQLAVCASDYLVVALCIGIPLRFGGVDLIDIALRTEHR